MATAQETETKDPFGVTQDDGHSDNDLSDALIVEPPASDPDPEPAEPEPEPEPASPKDNGWDKERQLKDELRAAQTREQQANRQREELAQKVDDLTAKMDAMAQQQDDGNEIDLDTFEGLQAAVKQITAKLSEADTKAAQYEQKISGLEGQLKEVSSTTEREQGAKALDQICSQMDAKYSPSVRNQAVENVNAEYVDMHIGDLPPDSRRKWILKNLEAEYQRLSASAKPSGDKTVTPPKVGTGTGGSVKTEAPLREGTFDEVARQLDSRAKRPKQRLS